jgi:hypothetical protein
MKRSIGMISAATSGDIVEEKYESFLQDGFPTHGRERKREGGARLFLKISSTLRMADILRK